MRFEIITVFPEFFDGPFRYGVVARAVEAGRIGIGIHNLRAFASDRHQTVDDRPFGGGEGMVLKPEPLFGAVESLQVAARPDRDVSRERVILLSAQGRKLTQAVARELAVLDRIVLICGRYEGVDERVSELLADSEISIGDYVLSGGELCAAVVIDAVARLVPGVLGNQDSTRYESFSSAAGDCLPTGLPQSSCDSGGILDYAHYTRPAEFRGYAVPAVLSSGNHSEIRRWRRRQALEKTRRNRPDLLAAAVLSEEDHAMLRELEGR